MTAREKEDDERRKRRVNGAFNLGHRNKLNTRHLSKVILEITRQRDYWTGAGPLNDRTRNLVCPKGPNQKGPCGEKWRRIRNEMCDLNLLAWWLRSLKVIKAGVRPLTSPFPSPFRV